MINLEGMEGRWELKGESIKVMGKMGDWDEKEKENIYY